MPFLFNFKDIFVSIFLDVSDIEVEEDLDINESKNFNVNIQIYLAFEREHKEFIVIRVNFNIIRNNNEEYLYNEDDLYFESNNIGYNGIIQMNCIYNYCIFYLKSKIINNFFFKPIFRSIRKAYREEETRYWIFIIRIAIYRIFILLLEYLPIYIKKEVILKRC